MVEKLWSGDVPQVAVPVVANVRLLGAGEPWTGLSRGDEGFETKLRLPPDEEVVTTTWPAKFLN